MCVYIKLLRRLQPFLEARSELIQLYIYVYIHICMYTYIYIHILYIGAAATATIPGSTFRADSKQ